MTSRKRQSVVNQQSSKLGQGSKYSTQPHNKVISSLSSAMDQIGIDLQMSDRAYEEYGDTRAAAAEDTGQADTSPNQSSITEDRHEDTDGGSSSTPSTYQTSGELASSTTVPVSDSPDHSRAQGPASTSSTSSSSSNDSRMVGASLYHPEFLTPSISYDRESPDQLLVALIGRAFDQPEKLATQLQQLVSQQQNSENPVARFTPFTVKRKTLCRGHFDSSELRKHDLICLCYNASEARILLTGQDGYYSALLRQIEILMGELRIANVYEKYDFRLLQKNRALLCLAVCSRSQ